MSQVSWAWLSSCRTCGSPHDVGADGEAWIDPYDGHYPRPRLPLDQVAALRQEYENR